MGNISPAGHIKPPNHLVCPCQGIRGELIKYLIKQSRLFVYVGNSVWLENDVVLTALGRNKVPHPRLRRRQSQPHVTVKAAVTTSSLQKNHTVGPTSERCSALLSMFRLSIKRLLSKHLYRHHLSCLLTSRPHHSRARKSL